MSSKLNIQDIVDLLVVNNDISKEEAGNFIVEFISLIEKGLSTDELVKVKDFGTFKLTQIQERESVDVNTQKKIVIPSHRRVSFIPAPTLKGLVNKPFAHFEATPLSEGVFIEGLSQGDSPEIDDEDYIAEDEDLTKTTSKEDIPASENPIVAIEDESELKEIVEEEADLPCSAPIVDNNIIDSPPTESLSADNEKIPSEEKTTVGYSKKAKPKQPKSRGKLKRYILRWDVAIALFMIVGVGVAYSYYFAKHNPSMQGVEDSDIPKPIKTITPTRTKNKESNQSAVSDSVKTTKRVKPPQTVKMSPGRTLRLIALDKFGDREFWIYIYMKNKDKLKNPNVVPVGLILELPSKDEFDMDANNPNDVFKAKELGDQVMKSS